MSKSILGPADVIFTPAAKTLDFSRVQSFDPSRLMAVINASQGGAMIYAAGSTTMGYSAKTGSVLTLMTDTTAMASSDVLTVIYDDDGLSGAQNRLARGAPFTVSSVTSTTTGTVAFDLDCSQYGSLLAVVEGTFSGQAIAWEQSLDGRTWVSMEGMEAVGRATSSNNTPGGFSGTSGTTRGWIFPIYGARVRARVTALASGAINFMPYFLKDRVNIWTSVSGPAIHNNAVAGGPVPMGMVGRTASSAVSNGYIQHLMGTLDGKLVVQNDCIPELSKSYAGVSGGITGTTAATMAAAAGSNLRTYLKSLQVKNVSATATEVVVRDGASGTVLWRGYAPASMAVADNIMFNPPLRGSANTLMEVACLTTGTQTYVNAQMFTGA